MNLLIVTGMSGAGKSLTANALEDMGYFCVDNIPPAIIPVLVEFSSRGGKDLQKMAIVTDIRGGEMFNEINDVLLKLKENNVDYKILFLDAEDKVLVRRYKENRRKHPLCDKGLSVSEAVKSERTTLKYIRDKADFTVDTSLISVSQLKNQLSDIFLSGDNDGLKILCKSFGFKYGADGDADLVFDVRCLPNPYYIDDLKLKTGLDAPVNEYVMSFPESKEFARKIKDFLDFSVPLYLKEGKSQLVIAFGCTGGKHRSVTFAELISCHLKDKGYDVSTLHRDIKK